MNITASNTTAKLDRFERGVRFGLGIVLLLIGWDYGWTVVGTGAVVLGLIAVATAASGRSPLTGFSATRKELR